MHRYWLQIAINLCGSRTELAKRIGVPKARITYWLNQGMGIILENAIKIEKAVEGKVKRWQLLPRLDRALKRQLQEEYEALKKETPKQSLRERVALGLAHEQALGHRKGARSDLTLRENFPKVEEKHPLFSSGETPLRGRTHEIAARYAGFGNYKTYQQAKYIVEKGIEELIAAVDQHRLPMSRAAKIVAYAREEQLYFLSLPSKAMIQALKARFLQSKNAGESGHQTLSPIEDRPEHREKNHSMTSWMFINVLILSVNS